MKGKEFENIAIEYLKRKGYEIIGRNIRSKYGEIDILADYKGRKIVVEVKGGRCFNPVENFTKKKYEKILKTAFEILGNEDFQIDLVVVYKDKIIHYKNVGLDYGEEDF